MNLRTKNGKKTTKNQTKWTSNFHDGKFRKVNQIPKLNSKLCRE